MKNQNRNKTTQFILIAFIIMIVSLGTQKLFEEAKKLTLTNKAKAVSFFNMSYEVAEVSVIRPVVEKETCELLYEYKTTVTAYNAGDPNQTDGNPCISANGENICTALALGYKRCASNKYLFGTLLEVEGYGRCIVTDRMNKRFPDRVDVAFTAEKKQEAIDFGAKERNIKVLRCK